MPIKQEQEQKQEQELFKCNCYSENLFLRKRKLLIIPDASTWVGMSGFFRHFRLLIPILILMYLNKSGHFDSKKFSPISTNGFSTFKMSLRFNEVKNMFLFIEPNNVKICF